MIILFWIIFFIIQTTLINTIFPFFKPEIFIVFLALFCSGQTYYRGVFTGFACGLALDSYSGKFFYSTIIFALLGFLFSLFSEDFFKDFRSLVIVNTILGSILWLILFLSINYFQINNAFFLLWYDYILLLVINVGLAVLLTNLPTKYFGINVRD
ncbi:hypothetical protein OAR19_00595 [bacterium]|nr:hypothetical protein [bacterium]